MKKNIKDIAQAAGVSVTTVSLVLNQRQHRIAKETVERIQAIAKEYGYAPNYLAQGLVTKKTKTIGLIIPDIENYYFSSLAKQVEEDLTKHGYSVFFVNTNDQFKEELRLIQLMGGRGIDGLLITPSYESFLPQNAPLLQSTLKELKIPFVLMDRAMDDWNCHRVTFDNRLGGYIATKHLLEKGHQRIAFISSPLVSQNGRQRLDGYKRALQEQGVGFDETLVLEGDFRIKGGYLAGQKVPHTKATALFASNDMMAFGAIKALREKGYQIPDDYSIVGYDNLTISDMLDIPLTSVDQDVKTLAKHAVDILLADLQGTCNEVQKITLTPILKVKKSVKKKVFSVA